MAGACTFGVKRVKPGIGQCLGCKEAGARGEVGAGPGSFYPPPEPPTGKTKSRSSAREAATHDRAWRHLTLRVQQGAAILCRARRIIRDSAVRARMQRLRQNAVEPRHAGAPGAKGRLIQGQGLWLNQPRCRSVRRSGLYQADGRAQAGAYCLCRGMQFAAGRPPRARPILPRQRLRAARCRGRLRLSWRVVSSATA
jgi:hypothetical protein